MCGESESTSVPHQKPFSHSNSAPILYLRPQPAMTTSTPPKPPRFRRPTPPKVLTTIRSMHLRRNAPPPIPIPINPIRPKLEIARPKRAPETMARRNDARAAHRPPKLSTLPVTPTQQAINAMHSEPSPIDHLLSSSEPEPRPEHTSMFAVEISNYSSLLSPSTIAQLFSSYPISPNFQMPSTTKFAYPLRTIIWIQGLEVADRAVKELNGTIIGNRQINVTRLDLESAEIDAGKENTEEEAQKQEGHQQKRVWEEEGELKAEANTVTDTDVVITEMADELKIAIISKSRLFILSRSW